MKISDKFDEAVDAIIAEMEEKGTDWVKSWSCAGGLPVNLSTQKEYRGINVLFLLMNAWKCGYESAQYLTYKQAKSLGGNVKKGERGVPIFFYSDVEKKELDKDGNKQSYAMMRSFIVFNVEQVEGIKYDIVKLEIFDNERKEEVESMLKKTTIPVIFSGTQPRYYPQEDRVYMTELKYFNNINSYYTTFFHELGHATGHISRLDRDMRGREKDSSYAFEELIAEITACLMAGKVGIGLEEGRHAEYLNGWISMLKNNKRTLWKAASRAQKATDWLLDDMGFNAKKVALSA